MAKMSTASKILLGAGLLYLIDLFLPWYTCKVSNGLQSAGCGSANGWHGFLGVLCGILVILIIAMEFLVAFNVNVNLGTPEMRNQVEAGGAGLLVLLTILHFLIKPGGGGSAVGVSVHIGWGIWAFLGVLLALAVGYGGYMRWQESQVATPPPSPPGGGFAP